MNGSVAHAHPLPPATLRVSPPLPLSLAVLGRPKGAGGVRENEKSRGPDYNIADSTNGDVAMCNNDKRQAVLDRARARADKAKAALAKVETQIKNDARKVDTRRAIIIGKLLLKAAGDDAHFAEVAREMVARATPRDRELFPDFSSQAPCNGENV